MFIVQKQKPKLESSLSFTFPSFVIAMEVEIVEAYL